MKPNVVLFTVMLAACTAGGADKAAVDTDATDVSLPNDEDGDGYRADVDCDDTNPLVNPGRAEICNGADDNCDNLRDESDDPIDDPNAMGPLYLDADVDGFGDRTTGRYYCESPNEARVDEGGDCNDNNPNVRPGAVEICDGIDNDCDDLTDSADDSLDIQASPDAVQRFVDVDGDGVGAGSLVWSCSANESGFADVGGDCDDDNAERFPGNAELCDGIDNDCDNDVDADDADVAEADVGTFYADADQDGFGNRNDPGTFTCISLKPAGTVTNRDDCNDTNNAIKPGASEVCDGVDNDCDDDVDLDDASLDGSTTITLWTDTDNDGFGAPGTSRAFCVAPASGWASNDDDCAPTDGDRHPNATEVCNFVDDDCNTDVDDNDAGVEVDEAWYLDLDGDTYPDPNNAVWTCSKPSKGYRLTASNADCLDSDNAAHPGAAEVYYDGVDQDCLGGDDWDADGDGHREGTAPGGGDDCDDTLASVNPDADEVPYDTIDNDCLGGDLCDVDGDLQLASECGGDDCVDADADVGLGFAEVCDGKDNDCDDAIDGDDDDLDASGQVTLYVDEDGDGFGSTTTIQACANADHTATNNTDCLDTNADVNPDAVEVCNGLDDDCIHGTDDADPNVVVTEPWYPDADGDGVPKSGVAVMTCAQPANHARVGEYGFDCLDIDRFTFPGSAPLEDNPGACRRDLDDDDYGDNTVASPVVPGTDCDDDEAEAFPGQVEVWYDGIDGDCDGANDFDQDGDGVDALGHGGEDCDDTNWDVRPGVVDIPFNTIDEDCDGSDSCDSDGDGLCDADEVATLTDPFNPDSDNDAYSDGEEIANGTDPNDDSSPGGPEGKAVSIHNDGLSLWVTYEDGQVELRRRVYDHDLDDPRDTFLDGLHRPNVRIDTLHLDCGLDGQGYPHCRDDGGLALPTVLARSRLRSLSFVRSAGRGGCAVFEDGHMACFDDQGEPRADLLPPDVDARVWKDVEIRASTVGNTSNGCARDEDHEVVCWKTGGVLTPSPAVPLEQWVSQSGSGCGVDSAGSLACWGSSNLSLGKPSGTGFKKVVSTAQNPCAINASDEVQCWGTSAFRPIPANLPSGSPVIDIATVTGYSTNFCFLQANGVVSCAGRSGQYSVMFAADPPPTHRGMDNACSIGTDGKAICWTVDNQFYSAYKLPASVTSTAADIDIQDEVGCIVTSLGTIACAGYTNRWPRTLPASTFSGSNFREVAVSRSLGLYIGSQGGIYAFDPGNTSTAESTLLNTRPAGPGYRDLELNKESSDQACVINADDEVVCWGASMLYPPPTEPMNMITSFSAGANNESFRAEFCGLRADNSGVCWGSNSIQSHYQPSNTQAYLNVAVGEHGAYWETSPGYWEFSGTAEDDWLRDKDTPMFHLDQCDGEGGYNEEGRWHAWAGGVFRDPPEHVLADADRDAIPDVDEASFGTEVHNADTDGDGLSDGREVWVEGTDPLVADSDGDGVNDGDEVAAGTDPWVP